MQHAIAALSGVQVTRTPLRDGTVLYEARDAHGVAIESRIRADREDETLVYAYFGAYFDALPPAARPPLRLVG